MKTAWIFSKYIEYAQFPNFKQLEPNSKLEFSFPYTILTWKNWSWKSSVLKAIYGAPEWRSPWSYWFSSTLDPIRESWVRASMFYWYRTDEWSVVEVLKQRIKRSQEIDTTWRIIRREDPDYWETSRPLKSYWMSQRHRVPPVSRNVLYIDFKEMISAFDKYFYFFEPKKNSKQQYLRLKSRKLKRAFDWVKDYWPTQQKPLINFDATTLEEVSYILGKEYTGWKIIEHKFFQEWWYSILFSLWFEYSDAFAGSGESSVFNLIYRLNQLDDFSLVLLDEPETSLHPGAQLRMKEVIFEKIKQKKLQVIISTHSNDFIEWIPDSAIKIIHKGASNKYTIKNECKKSEAFFEVERTIWTNKIIFVEDKLALEVITAVIKNETLWTSLEFFKEHPGWYPDIFKSIVSVLHGWWVNYAVIWDWDKYKEIRNIESMTHAETSLPNLKRLIREVCECEIDIAFNSGESIEAKTVKYKQFYIFLYNNLKFLPLSSPEEIIRNEDRARSILAWYSEDEITSIIREPDFKRRYELIAHLTMSWEITSWTILSVQKMFIWHRVRLKDEHYQSIVTLLSGLIT